MTDRLVVLLHGLGHTRWSMVRPALALRRRGWRVLNLTYPSTKLDLAGIVDFLHEKLVLAGVADEELSFVTHSMGGIVVRAYVTRFRPRIGRVVMIAPPNSGNEIIDRIHDGVWWGRLTRRMIRRAFPALTTRRTPATAAQLGGAADYPLGIVAGTTSWYAAGHVMVPRPNDGIVSVESTKLAGMHDHLQMPGSHSLMLLRKSVSAAVVWFLENGKF